MKNNSMDDFADQINNLADQMENLLKNLGIDLDQSNGIFEVGNMQSIEGRGFGIDIPENYVIARDLDGKEIIAFEEGYNNYLYSPLNIQVGIQQFQQPVSEEQFIQLMQNHCNNMNVECNVLVINGNKATLAAQDGLLGGIIYHVAIYNTDYFYQLRITFNLNFENTEEVKDVIINSFKTIDNYESDFYKDNIDDESLYELDDLLYKLNVGTN